MICPNCLTENPDAATHFKRALEAAKGTNAEPNLISRLHLQLGSALEQNAQYQQALDSYDEMLAFASAHNDRSMELSALMSKATVYSTFTNVHDPELSERTLIRALEVSQEIGDTSAQARLNWNLMLVYLFSKRLDESLQYGEAALELARKGDNREYLAFVLNDLCRLYTCRGEFDKAHGVIREARELWRTFDNRVMLADSLGSESEAYFNAGEYEQALECSQQALRINEEINNLWGQAYENMLIAFVYFQTGRLGQGIPFAEKASLLGDQAGMIAINTMRCETAWIYVFCGAYEKGFEIIDYAIQQAQAHQPAWAAFPQAVKVRMHLLHGNIAGRDSPCLG